MDLKKKKSINIIANILIGSMALYFIFSVLVAMCLPTPLLVYPWIERHENIIKKKIRNDIEHSYDLITKSGNINICVLSEECCLQVIQINGRIGKYCFHDAEPYCNTFRIDRIKEKKMTEAFKVTIGSDLSGSQFHSAIISGEGQRLFDGMCDRIFRRVDEYPFGKAIFAFGPLCLLWRLWKRRGILSFLGTIAGFSLNITMLWSNM